MTHIATGTGTSGIHTAIAPKVSAPTPQEEENSWTQFKNGGKNVDISKAFLDYINIPPIEHYIEDALEEYLLENKLTREEFEALPEEEKKEIMQIVRERVEQEIKEKTTRNGEYVNLNA